jgi:methylthioribose-1-phosphate isomerase
VRSPSFDVTPAHLITAIVTDNGIERPPFRFDVRERR